MFNTPPRDKLMSRKVKMDERLETATGRILTVDKIASVSRTHKSEPVKSSSTKKGSVASAASTTSSSLRRKQLELAAAEQRAMIQMELINKRLELDLAMVADDQRTQYGSTTVKKQSNVDEWLETNNVQPSPSVKEEVPAVATTTGAARQPDDDPARAPAQNAPADSILQLAHTLKDIMVNSSTRQEERLLTRLSTPRELPTFSGDCIEWLHFKSAYDESTRVCNFSDTENLWRLRRALRGDAKEAVTDLLIGATAPAVIMESLELRFGQSDLIVCQLTTQMKKLCSLSTNYHNDIIAFSMKINNCVATLYALNQHDYLRSPELSATIISKLPSILISKYTDYAYCKLTSNIPKLQMIASFLKQEAEKVSLVGVSHLRDSRKLEPIPTARRPEEKSRPYSYNRPILATESSSNVCCFCKKSVHVLSECRVFKRAMRKDRWRFVKSQGLCFCCLRPDKHERNMCPAAVCDIDGCGLAHHRLLHFKKPCASSNTPSQQLEDVTQTAISEDDTSLRRATVAHAAPVPTRDCDVLLKVVKVNLCGPNGIVTTYALLDDGASISMIDKTLVNELGLSSSQSSPIKFVDAFGLEVFQSDAPKIHTKISSFYKNVNYNITLRQVDRLKLPKQNFTVVNNLNCKHILKVKDFVCKECVAPRLLIGEDNYFLLAPLEILHGSRHEPYATKTRLGWSVHGRYGLTHSPVKGHIMHLAHTDASAQVSTNINELNELVKKSFELDSIGVSTLRRENTAHLRAVRILDETARHIGNRWEVGLPLAKDKFILPDTYDYARSRLLGTMKKFRRDSTYGDRYKAEMQKLFDNGYARELNEEDARSSGNHIWYLSHFGVQNPNKLGKLRLVFDCAGKVKGVCLNDYLLTGPDLYNSLLGIMLRFREHKIVVIGDIKDFFTQILIRPEDQDLFRFLWQENVNSPIKTFKMQRLLFGATCSPFIAQYVKNKNAEKYQDLYPEAVDIIINNHYMDDCLYSCDTESQAIRLVQEITTIHKAGGFTITQWSSNSKPVLQSLPSEALAPNAIEFKHGATNTTERTLGLMWHPNDDSFGFRVATDKLNLNILNGTEVPTKAQVLSILMSVYDLHGFLSPFTVKGKIIFQNIHRSGVEWHCRIQPEEHTLWLSWLNDLQCLRSLRIPRHYGSAHKWIECYSSAHCIQNAPSDNDKISHSIIDIQMHIFSDASSKAYAAAIYWRFTRSDGCVLVCFVASKSRVSPLRPISIPRLELQGALLAARLATTVQREHKDLQATKRFFWTDSSTVLQWIRSDPRDYKPYVAHRLGEIDELTKSNEWRHVPTALNVADVATREDSPPLVYSSDWFQGPSFLYRTEEQWPRDLKRTKSLEEATCEEKSVHMVVHYSSDLPLPSEDRISSWTTLVRATSRVLLFVRRCQRKICNLDVVLMKEAEDLLIRKSQSDSFPSELTYLKQNKQLPTNSRLLQVTPYLDEAGILRVSGRIDKVVGVEYPTCRPVILDGRHRITRLLVEHYHRQAFHGANELVVNNLRQHYWILQLRPTVRSIASRCLFCRYRRATPQPQRMADLPAARLQHNRRPFSYTGVDFFGPLEITVGRSRQKRYGMLFTCLTVRAIHIELTESLTTDSTIMALRRMAARRGMPQIIISDNGTNLRGADSELKQSIAELSTEAVREAGAVRGVDWRFIPPGAPEMGGSWERMIRTVKSSLKVVLKGRAPHLETLLTLLAEVEAIVNSRPITHVSSDPNYPEALTPNHFLIGSSSTGPQFGKYDDTDLCLRKRWRVAQRLADMFWARWLKEYLPTLLPRQKWTQEARSLQVGDYVIIVEPNLDRNCWRHGVVSATVTGEDGRVRVVDVRTRTGVLRRPVTRVALLAERDD